MKLPNDFLISRFIALPAAAKDLMLEIPETLARRQYTPYGDVPPGVYLTWAGFRGLDANEFRMAGFKGKYFDVGGLGDELFLRAGFHEAEGTPPATVRWTTGRFALDVSVWPGGRAFRDAARGRSGPLDRR